MRDYCTYKIIVAIEPGKSLALLVTYACQTSFKVGILLQRTLNLESLALTIWP